MLDNGIGRKEKGNITGMIGMKALKRILMFISAVLLAIFAVSLLGGPGVRYMVAPLTMLSVVGLTMGLAMLTYEPKKLIVELAKIFVGKEKDKDISKKMISQIALFALVSGIILAIMYVLVGLDADRPAQNRLESLRTPFMSLLYGILLALGMWIAGQDEQNVAQLSKTRLYDQTQVAISSCLLLLAMGVVGCLLIGMTRDNDSHYPRETGIEQLRPNMHSAAGMLSNTTLAADNTDLANHYNNVSSHTRVIRKHVSTALADGPGSHVALLRWEEDIQGTLATPPSLNKSK